MGRKTVRRISDLDIIEKRQINARFHAMKQTYHSSGLRAEILRLLRSVADGPISAITLPLAHF